MAGTWRVEILGPVRVVRPDGSVVAVSGLRRHAILAALAVNAPQVVHRSMLLEALWGETVPDGAVNAAQAHISYLRRSTTPALIETVGDGYRLGLGVTTDLADFERHARAVAAAADPDQARAGSAAALALWRGEPFTEFSESTYWAAPAAAVVERYLSLVQERLAQDLQSDDRSAGAVSDLAALVARWPLREGFRELLMRALAADGRPIEALAVFDEGRRLVGDEYGLDFSTGLRELRQAILTGEVGPRARHAEASRSATLPAHLDRTIGRADDLDAVSALLADRTNRLVSLLGPGGVGKTRLAVDLGHRLGGGYRDGVVFVPLIDAAKPQDVPAVIAARLQLRVGDDPVEALQLGLAGQDLLLILDNFEHVIDAGLIIPRILGTSPTVTTLVTSRQRLRLRGEITYTVGPLASGREEPRDVELFTDRARQADPLFDPDPAEAQLIVDICRRCDGLPLAIELAAGQVRSVGLHGMHASMPATLEARSSIRDVPERQRSLRTNIAWSVSALPVDAARFLGHLSVFRGGFTAAAAGAVAGTDTHTTAALLDQLLDHSLVAVDRTARGSRRFTMLEMVREWAAEALSDAERAAAHHRHGEHFLARFDPTDSPMTRPQQAESWAELLVERPNIRHAVRIAFAAGDFQLAADLVVSASSMWEFGGPQAELSEWLDGLQDAPGISPGRRFDVLYRRAAVADRSAPGTGRDHLARAHRFAADAGDIRRLAWAEHLRAWFDLSIGDLEAGQESAARALAANIAAGNIRDLIGTNLNLQAHLAYERGDIVAALGYLAEGMDLAETAGYDFMRSVLLNNMCEMNSVLHHYREVIDICAAGLDLAERMQAPGRVADFLSQRVWPDSALLRAARTTFATRSTTNARPSGSMFSAAMSSSPSTTHSGSRRRRPGVIPRPPRSRSEWRSTEWARRSIRSKPNSSPSSCPLIGWLRRTGVCWSRAGGSWCATWVRSRLCAPYSIS